MRMCFIKKLLFWKLLCHLQIPDCCIHRDCLGSDPFEDAVLHGQPGIIGFFAFSQFRGAPPFRIFGKKLEFCHNRLTPPPPAMVKKRCYGWKNYNFFPKIWNLGAPLFFSEEHTKSFAADNVRHWFLYYCENTGDVFLFMLTLNCWS